MIGDNVVNRALPRVCLAHEGYRGELKTSVTISQPTRSTKLSYAPNVQRDFYHKGDAGRT